MFDRHKLIMNKKKNRFKCLECNRVFIIVPRKEKKDYVYELPTHKNIKQIQFKI